MAMCPFCFEETKLSKEHLFSRPVCAAAGIDRSGMVAQYDGNRDTVGSIVPLDQRSVRLPCEPCNNGWMGDLENQMASVIRRWPGDGRRPLGTDRSVLIRWLAKTTFVLAFSDGNARRFMDGASDAALPHVPLARRLQDGEVPEEVRIGAAQVKAGSKYLYAFGNPTVELAAADDVNCRSVQVGAFNLGVIQLWCVIPLFEPDSLRWPKNVIELKTRTRFANLRHATDYIDTPLVNASFSRKTNDTISHVLNSLRKEPDSKPGVR